jgi:hypothetical protein
MTDPHREEEAVPRPSTAGRKLLRRQVLGGVAAAAAGGAVGVVGGATPAGATQGADVLLGEDNTGASARTGIFSTTDNLYATLADPSLGIDGSEITAGVFGSGTYGVVGYSSSTAVDLWGNPGVLGTDATPNVDSPSGVGVGVQASIDNESNSSPALLVSTNGSGPGAMVLSGNGQPGINVFNDGSGPCIQTSDELALFGRPAFGTGSGLVAELNNPDNTSSVVNATTAGSGPGVYANSVGGDGIQAISQSASSAGVSATNTTGGTALAVDGAATFSGVTSFSRSGLAAVAKGADSVSVTGVALSSSSMVLATLQTNVGKLGVRCVTTSSSESEFTIYLTEKAPANCNVAWLVIG